MGAVPVPVCEREWPAHEHEPSRLAVGGSGTFVRVRVQCEAANLVARLA